MKKIVSIMAAIVLALGVCVTPMEIKAASAAISASSTTVYVGDKVNISVNVSGANMYTVKGSIASSNPGVLSGSGSIYKKADLADSNQVNGISSVSGQATFSANAVGQATVTFTPESANCIDVNYGALNLNSPVVTINVINRPSASGGGSTGGGNNTGGNTSGGGNTQPTQPEAPEKDDRSTNNNLASLTVSEGQLSPAFDAGKTEYKLSLSSKATKISVNAKAADAKAKVSGVGEKTLSVGENKISVVVTAENGATKEYVIIATVDDKPEVYLTYDSSKLGVVRNLSGITAPEGFEETKLTIGGKEVKAWKNNRMNTTIIYLVNEKTEEKNFYVYDTKTKKIGSVIKPVAILGNNVYIVDIAKDDQALEGLTYKKIKVDNTELMGWEFNDKEFKNYYLIYVMDENGKMQYYQYEKTQNTLQKYSGAAPVSQASYDELTKDLDSANTMKLVFMILSGIFAVTTIAGGVIVMKLRSKIK